MNIKTTEIARHVGETVTLHGWLHHVRRLGGVNFVIVRDGYGLAQAVAGEMEIALLEGMAQGTVIEVVGEVVSAQSAPNGAELHAPQITVITPISEPPPFTLHQRTLNVALPTLLDHAVVANRHPQRRAVLRLSAGAMAAFRRSLNAQAFTEIQTPKLVASATEGGANVFRLGYYGGEAFLAQSPQFYKQIMVGVFERVYEVSPVFRAEPHNTSRHLAEYVSMDVEFGFIRNHLDVMAVAERVIREIMAELEERFSAELQLLNATLPEVEQPFPHIHFRDAQQLIYERHGVDVRGEPDLSPQDERWLGEWAQAEHDSDFLFVTGYPMVKRPFYTHPDPTEPTYSNSFDLLFRGTELITGGQRLHVYEEYLAALDSAELPHAPFVSYLEAFKHGMPPHGGFAIGLERLIMQLLGLSNVRLATLFPRDMGRLLP